VSDPFEMGFPGFSAMIKVPGKAAFPARCTNGSDFCGARKNRPTGGRDGSRGHLRGGLPRVLLRIPAGTRPARCAGRPPCRHSRLRWPRLGGTLKPRTKAAGPPWWILPASTQIESRGTGLGDAHHDISVMDTVNIAARAAVARRASPVVVQFGWRQGLEGGHACCKITQTYEGALIARQAPA
jgi:hypothetical protein